MNDVRDKMRKASRTNRYEDEEYEYETDEYEDDEYDDEYEDDEEEYEKQPVRTMNGKGNPATMTYRESAERRKRRNVFLAFFYILVTAFLLSVMVLFLKNTRSGKESLREQGIEQYRNDNYAEAMALFDSSLSEHQWFSKNMDIDTRMYIAACYMKQKNFEAAITIYEDLIQNGTGRFSKDSVKGLKYLAEALLDVKSGNLNENNMEALKGTAEAGDSALFLYVAAYYANQNNSEKMVEYLQKFLEKNEINTYAAFELSNFYLKQDNPEKAKVYIDRGLSCKDDIFRDSVRFNEAVYYEKMDDMDNALSIVTELHEKYPENKEYLNEYNFLYTRLNVDPEPVHVEEDE